MSEMSMGAIWSSLPVPVLVIGEKDIISEINPAAEGFLNMSERALVGTSLWRCISINTQVSESFERVRENLTPLFVNDVSVEMGPKSTVLCNLKFTPLLGMAGFMLLLIEPRNLAGRLTQTQSGKSAAKSAIGMAEMLAHEIKNPLAGIMGAAQLLSMSLPPKDLELTDLVVAETRRILKLLEQVEQFGNLKLVQKSAVNIHDILDRVRRSSQLGFGAHMTYIEEYDPSLPAAYGDADQLLQVVLNLVKNASEAASPSGGKIRLKTYYEHSFRMRRSDGSGQNLPLQIEIWDDGPGLPSDIRSDVFDPFVSGRENGTGLGLALASKIISDHDGWLSVDSVPGKTVFRISLPLVPREEKVKG